MHSFTAKISFLAADNKLLGYSVTETLPSTDKVAGMGIIDEKL